MKTDKVPYDIWAQQGWITVTPGSVVDYNFVKEYIRTMESDNDFKIKKYVRIRGMQLSSCKIWKRKGMWL